MGEIGGACTQRPWCEQPLGQPVPCTLHGALGGPLQPASQRHAPSAPHVPCPLQSATQRLLAHAGEM